MHSDFRYFVWPGKRSAPDFRYIGEPRRATAASRSRRPLVYLFALALALTAAAPTTVEARSNGCKAWTSSSTPPTVIRVLIGRRVARVPIRLYTARVVSSEWNNVAPQLRKAGAVAVRQYAWWKAMHPRRSQYGCFDVHPDTRDQIYKAKPVRQIPDYIWSAVDSTATWRLVRAGRLIMTGYRTGAHRNCARDVRGYKLYARSAKRCVQNGWGTAQILKTYYNARLVR